MTNDLKARLDAMVDEATPPQHQPVEFDGRGLYVAQLETVAIDLLRECDVLKDKLGAAEARIAVLESCAKPEEGVFEAMCLPPLPLFPSVKRGDL